MDLFDFNNVEKIITYYDGTGKWSCKFILNTLDSDGRVEEVILPEKEAYPYLKKYLKDVKGYTPASLEDGTIDNDPTFALNKNLDQMVEETTNTKLAIHNRLKAEKEEEPVGAISNFKHNKAMYGLLLASGLLIGGSIIGLVSHFSHKKDVPVTPEATTESDIDMENPIEVIDNTANTATTLWEAVQAKAIDVQKQFMSALAKTMTTFNQQFASKHYEENVVFPDGHTEPLVQFGISPEEFASAYILGANFTPEEYQTFMNDSNISVLEYYKYWQQWMTQMHHAYLVKGSQEDVGILNYVTDEEGIEYITKVDSLHSALRDAKERGDIEGQRKYLNELHQIFMTSYKMEEAAQLEPTYENFVSLNLPDYVLVAKPIFDSIHEEYRNVLMDDGTHFYDELYEKNFVDGIYCHIYEWTMAENIASQEARLSQVSYQSNESYADYDELIRASREYLSTVGLLKDSDNKNRYKVEYLTEVQEALANSVTWDIYASEEEYHESSEESYSGNSGGSENQDTYTETTVKKKKTKKKVKEEDLTPKEKKQADKQIQQIEEDLNKENEQNKEEAEKKADEAVAQDQKVEDEKKQEIDQQVESENKKAEEQIEQGQVPDGGTQDEPVDGNAVKDPTTDGTGAVDPSTPLPDPNEYYESTHSESTEAQPELPPATSDQSGTIVEGEVPIEYSFEVPAETSASVEEVAPASVEPVAVAEPVYEVPVEEASSVEVAAAEAANPNYSLDYYEISDAEKEAIVAMMNGQSVDEVVEQMAEVPVEEAGQTLQK